jgi:hypothetical protein
MHPAHGGRIVLRLASAEQALVYHVELYMNATDWRGTAHVELASGQVSFSGLAEGAGAPPEWLVQAARALLRATWRAGDGAWPRRITRWRAEPKSADA